MNAAELSVEFREICRYLGYRGTAPTPEVAEKISLCLSNLQKASVLSETHVVLPLESPEENVLVAGEMEIHSKNLYKNMRGCHACCLFAATIGIGCDRLIARAELTSMADAAIYQAAGAALIEAVCDQLNLSLKELARSKGLFLRPRFSPGYGDVPLALQKDFFRILDPAKNCGISLSDSLLMSPSKSVTALIGVSEKDTPCILDGCESCENAATCAFRR